MIKQIVLVKLNGSQNKTGSPASVKGQVERGGGVHVGRRVIRKDGGVTEQKSVS